MTIEDARLILNNIDKLEHFVEGGRFDFETTNCDGEYRSYPNRKEKSLLISCLDRYKIVPHPPKCATCGQYMGAME